jgi:hypothetical protein
MNGLKQIQSLKEYKGIKIDTHILIPARFFGKDCTLLYKVLGFNTVDDWVYLQKLNKKTHKLDGHSLVVEGFKYDDIIKFYTI